MTVREYIDTSVTDLEMHFRNCVSQLRDHKDICHLVSHMIRLADDNPEIREQFRDRISKLMK